MTGFGSALDYVEMRGRAEAYLNDSLQAQGVITPHERRLARDVLALLDASSPNVVYIVCEYGHEDGGTINAIKGVFDDALEADNEVIRLGELAHFVHVAEVRS